MGTRNSRHDLSTCPECGVTYSKYGGGHCRGGKYGGCCRTFTSDFSADAHRVGPHGSGRRCLTDEELATLTRKDGSIKWRLTPKGWTDAKPRDGRWNPITDSAEGVSPLEGTDLSV